MLDFLTPPYSPPGTQKSRGEPGLLPYVRVPYGLTCPAGAVLLVLALPTHEAAPRLLHYVMCPLPHRRA